MENRYFESTAKVISLEGRLKATELKVRSTKGRAKVANEKVAAKKIIAQATKTEVVRVVESYKESTNFKDEVNEAAYDAFKKRFEESKKKVSKVLNLLDLSKILVNEPPRRLKSVRWWSKTKGGYHQDLRGFY